MVAFFFQAEDGIRDGHVTGVQTCALPISVRTLGRWYDDEIRLDDADSALAGRRFTATFTNEPIDLVLQRIALTLGLRVEIGRASCRERGEVSGNTVEVKNQQKKHTKSQTR